MLVLFRCRHCFAECRANPAQDKGLVFCKKCRKQQALRYTEAIRNQNTVDVCAVCQHRDFYTRDEARKGFGLLCLMAGLGAAYFTYGASLLIGGWGCYWHFVKYPKLTICYHCYTKYRNCRLNPKHKEYDLELVDRFEKAVRNDRTLRDFP